MESLSNNSGWAWESAQEGGQHPDFITRPPGRLSPSGGPLEWAPWNMLGMEAAESMGMKTQKEALGAQASPRG